MEQGGEQYCSLVAYAHTFLSPTSMSDKSIARKPFELIVYKAAYVLGKLPP
jgi:hypothetical protein